MINNIMFVSLLSSLRFLVIGGVFAGTKFNLGMTPLNLKDFGFIPLNCKLEGVFSYMIMIFNILWNTCWTWELVNCVKNPMVYSENKHKYYQAVVYFVGILLTATAFGLS